MDQERHRALSHPTRARIVELVGEDGQTPRQLSEQLGQTLSFVSYHSSVLLRAGCLTGPDRVDDPGAPLDSGAPLRAVGDLDGASG